MQIAKQLELFRSYKTHLETPPAHDPHAAPEDRPRLTGQNATILALLRMGSCTNVELNRISLKYTSRISDLRAAGYRIKCHRGDGGVNTYTLQE